MLPAIKVWKMDYSFIIKNYLNPALWQKTWTLFEYKDFVITIKLTKIETENMRIVFRLTCGTTVDRIHGEIKRMYHIPSKAAVSNFLLKT